LYRDYGEIVLSLARNLVSAGFRPGEVIAVFLHNSWEFAIAYHAASLAGLIPTPLNPNYREREVRYQLADSCAVALITDAPQLFGISLAGLPHLRRVYTTRLHAPGTDPFSDLLATRSNPLPQALESPRQTIAALPYSSGTTGMPKGVMLSHENLVVNCRQLLVPGEAATYTSGDVVIGFLPLYHIYGLNVVLNPTLLTGGTVVLMPRFDISQCAQIVKQEQITWLNLVPPVMNAICAAAEQGLFPRAGEHRIRGTKSGAAPLAPDLPRRYTELTGIPVRQGYGMTEASPVTHLGYLEADRYRPASIGPAVAATECRLLREDGSDCATGEPGELVMRGPQFMLGYWNNREETESVLRDGWYYSGDIATADAEGFFRIVDRRKELIKYKGFAIAPAEIEAVLLEHPAVRDCGVIGKRDDECGEVPVAFVVLKESQRTKQGALHTELPGYVAERLISYKQPREVRFVESIPRNPSGKVLRKDLRDRL
ncbi:MAG: AMP-binding protein, partial [Acidobacteriaceae bacterium]